MRRPCGSGGDDVLSVMTVWQGTGKADKSKFKSWSLIPTDYCQCYYTMAARLRPVVELKCITNWVGHFSSSSISMVPPIIIEVLLYRRFHASC